MNESIRKTEMRFPEDIGVRQIIHDPRFDYMLFHYYECNFYMVLN